MNADSAGLQSSGSRGLIGRLFGRGAYSVAVYLRVHNHVQSRICYDQISCSVKEKKGGGRQLLLFRNALRLFAFEIKASHAIWVLITGFFCAVFLEFSGREGRLSLSVAHCSPSHTLWLFIFPLTATVLRTKSPVYFSQLPPKNAFQWAQTRAANGKPPLRWF